VSIKGNIKFRNLDYKEAIQYYRQIVMNTKEELFFLSLIVSQTIDFITRIKVPLNLPASRLNVEEY
jgi:ATP-binding cassette, subfamily G (WHITE), member 2, SNQ2